MNKPTKYLVGMDVVEATLSEGGGFYQVKILATGHEFRTVAWAFESVASRIVKDGEVLPEKI